MNLFTQTYLQIFTKSYLQLQVFTNLFTEVGLHGPQNVIETELSKTEPSWLGLRHTWNVNAAN